MRSCGLGMPSWKITGGRRELELGTVRVENNGLRNAGGLQIFVEQMFLFPFIGPGNEIRQRFRAMSPAQQQKVARQEPLFAESLDEFDHAKEVGW